MAFQVLTNLICSPLPNSSQMCRRMHAALLVSCIHEQAICTPALRTGRAAEYAVNRYSNTRGGRETYQKLSRDNCQKRLVSSNCERISACSQHLRILSSFQPSSREKLIECHRKISALSELRFQVRVSQDSRLKDTQNASSKYPKLLPKHASSKVEEQAYLAVTSFHSCSWDLNLKSSVWTVRAPLLTQWKPASRGLSPRSI